MMTNAARDSLWTLPAAALASALVLAGCGGGGSSLPGGAAGGEVTSASLTPGAPRSTPTDGGAADDTQLRLDSGDGVQAPTESAREVPASSRESDEGGGATAAAHLDSEAESIANRMLNDAVLDYTFTYYTTETGRRLRVWANRNSGEYVFHWQGPAWDVPPPDGPEGPFFTTDTIGRDGSVIPGRRYYIEDPYYTQSIAGTAVVRCDESVTNCNFDDDSPGPSTPFAQYGYWVDVDHTVTTFSRHVTNPVWFRLSDSQHHMPSSGTASFTGKAAGVSTNVASGTTHVGAFTADVTLTATWRPGTRSTIAGNVSSIANDDTGGDEHLIRTNTYTLPSAGISRADGRFSAETGNVAWTGRLYGNSASQVAVGVHGGFRIQPDADSVAIGAFATRR